MIATVGEGVCFLVNAASFAAVVYSLASPRRVHPRTGVVHKSVLKPVGAAYTNKTVDTDKGIVSEVDMAGGTPHLLIGPMRVLLSDVAGVSTI